MAIITDEAKAGAKEAARGARKVGKSAAIGTGHFVKKHKVISAGVGGYGLGAMSTKQYPAGYASTQNKGRAEDRHPYGGGY